MSLKNSKAMVDTQVVLAVFGTAAGVVSAYFASLQHRKSRGISPGTDETPARSSAPEDAKLWSTAVDKALESFRKARRDCQIEIVEQKNFERRQDRFSTSELILHVKYAEAGDGEAAHLTHRFDLKINKDGDILEIDSKGKRSADNEKFH